MGSIYEVSNSYNTHRIEHAQWEAGNTIRDSQNVREASDVALKEFTRTLNNQRRTDAAGKEYNKQVTNLAHLLDTTTTTNVNLQLAAAQIKGSLAAQAGAAGVGGSTVDLLNAATDLQRDIKVGANTEARDAAAKTGSMNNSDIIDSAYSAIDNSRYFGNFDRSVSIEPQRLKNRVGALIGSAFAFFLGGPSASNAAAGITMASYKANNGQYADANRYYSQAANDIAQAYKDWQGQQSGDKLQAWGTAILKSNDESKATLTKANDSAAENMKQWKKDSNDFSWFNF